MNEDSLSKLLLEITGDDPVRSENQDGTVWLNTSCPLARWTHKSGSDNSPSFGAMVNDEGRSNCHCFSCKVPTSMVSLVSQMIAYSGSSDFYYLEDIVSKAEKDIQIPDWDAEKKRRIKKKKQRQEILSESSLSKYISAWGHVSSKEYLEYRGISEVAAEKMGLLYDTYDFRVLFPVRDTSNLLYGFAGRSVIKSENDYPIRFRNDGKEIIYRKTKNYYGLKKELHILGSNLWISGKPIWVNEGLIGHAHLISIGADKYFNIGTIMGSQLSAKQASIIASNSNCAVLMLDNDEAGDAGIFGALLPDGKRKNNGALSLLKGHVRVVVPTWPVFTEGVVVDGVYREAGSEKDDPDQLTIQDIEEIYNKL